MNMAMTEPKLLAFDTSTESLSVAVRRGERLFEHSGPAARNPRPR